MRILACAIGFGLGPSGKLCSIVESNKCYEWYACGDKLDLSIYNSNPYTDTCWLKDETVLKQFVETYNICYAVDVLDPELALILTGIGVKVIYIDSLPFMWTKADLIPYNVEVYCGQKYPGYTLNPVLNSVNNYTWVDPIVPIQVKNEPGDYIVINFGGLHSPFGDGKEYFKIIMKCFAEVLAEKKVYITGGNNVVRLQKELFPQFQGNTYSHKEFLKLVSGSALFITSPGLTTIYETCGMQIKTIILPPQNLSQFYNVSIAEKVCKEVKVLDWNWEKLKMDYLEHFKNSPEEETVRFIYEQIRILSKNKTYLKQYGEYVKDFFAQSFRINECTVIENYGVQQVSNILCEIMGIVR